MKLARSKQIKKQLALLKQVFKVAAPYKILVDGTFFSSYRASQNLQHDLYSFFGDKCQVFITSCCLAEFEKIQSKNKNDKFMKIGLDMAKEAKLVKCGCPEGTNGHACILRVTDRNNPQKYFVATQDRALKRALEPVRNCLVIYVKNGSIIILDQSNIYDPERVFNALKTKEEAENEENHHEKKTKKIVKTVTQKTTVEKTKRSRTRKRTEETTN